MENRTVHESYAVKGMTCAACATSLQSHLESQKGISQVSVNFADNSALIAFDPDVIALKNIQKAADEIGYQVVKTEEFDEQAEYMGRLNSLRRKLIVSSVLTLPVFLLSMFLKDLIPNVNIVLFVLSTPVLVWSGSEFFVIALKKARHLTTNMDTLVALSTGTAYLFSVFNTFYPDFLASRGLTPYVYYESATVIITLILLGRFFEERAKYKTTGAIKQLMGIQPKFVEIQEEGRVQIKPVAEVKKGEVFLVKPGEKIALDGYVLHGSSYVDESMINGEPVAASKSKNDYVYAGTINQNGTLKVTVSKESSSTLLAQIIDLVKKAQSSKPPIQKTVDKIASIFVPVVMAIAAVAFIIWYLAGPEPQFTYSFLVLITVLIIACPCALGLATPTALMVGIGKGASMGILIKDAQSLEKARQINVLVIDKTGTLTMGDPEVFDVCWDERFDRSQEIQHLVWLEQHSEHPLSGAILDNFNNIPSETREIDFINHPGMGIQGKIDGATYFAGNQALMKENKLKISKTLSDFERKLLETSHTLVYYGNESDVICIMGIRDPVRNGVKQAIQGIQALGIEVVLLSGDNPGATQRIADEVGIKEFMGGVLPEDKGNYVKRRKTEGVTVAMAGDGINDAHALAEADIGIAMGSGTDIAMESAGITLMKSDIQHIRSAILLSRATVNTVHQNLFWAFAYNVLAIPIAAGILFPFTGFLLNPMIAGAAMAFSSVSVVSNSLRLKRKKINTYENV